MTFLSCLFQRENQAVVIARSSTLFKSQLLKKYPEQGAVANKGHNSESNGFGVMLLFLFKLLSGMMSPGKRASVPHTLF